MNPIASVAQPTTAHTGGTNQMPTVGKEGKAGQAKPGGFSQLVDNFVSQTNETQIVSDQGIQDLVTGKTDNVQQVVMAVAEAQMSFQLFMEIRNKLVDSYNELMRMQF